MADLSARHDLALIGSSAGPIKAAKRASEVAKALADEADADLAPISTRP